MWKGILGGQKGQKNPLKKKTAERILLQRAIRFPSEARGEGLRPYSRGTKEGGEAPLSAGNTGGRGGRNVQQKKKVLAPSGGKRTKSNHAIGIWGEEKRFCIHFPYRL